MWQNGRPPPEKQPSSGRAFKAGSLSTTPPPLKPCPATPAEAGGGGYVPYQKRPLTPRREPRTRDEGDQPRAAQATAGGNPPRRPKTPPPPAGGSSKKKLPTKEEDQEVITRQEQKAREAALQYESIEAKNEREHEMVTIIRECFAESARGWKPLRGSHLASRPWSLRAPQHFQQAYELGTPVAAWVTNMQQARHSMKLEFLPGEVDEERVNILQAADRYDDLRTNLELHPIPRAAYYLAQCRELHDRQVSGPTITAGWSSFVAGESEVLSSKVLLLGASGSRIYNLGQRGPADLLGKY